MKVSGQSKYVTVIIIKINHYERNNLIEYVNRFKQTCDVVKSHVETEFLEIFVIIYYEYHTYNTQDEQEQIKTLLEIDGVPADESKWPIQICHSHQSICNPIFFGKWPVLK